MVRIMNNRELIESDQYLINQIKNGDSYAFDLLYKKHSHKVYYFALRYLKNIEDTEGVVQDLFMYIWTNRSKLKTNTNIQAYFFTITFNLIKKAFRKESYKQEYIKELLLQRDEEVNYIIEEEIHYQSLIEQVKKILNELSPRKRQIFEMSRFQGMSGNEIAKALNISRATVDNQISETTKIIRKKINISFCVGTFLLFTYFI